MSDPTERAACSCHSDKCCQHLDPLRIAVDLLDGLDSLMLAPLPRVWDNVEGGLAEPQRATVTHDHPNLAGGLCKLKAVSFPSACCSLYNLLMHAKL